MDKIRSLQIGKEYTLAGFTLGGQPYFTRFRLTKLTYLPCNYADSYILKVAMGVCNRQKLIRLEPEKQFIIWEGYHTPNITLVFEKKIKDFDSGAVAVGTPWPLWDPRYMARAKASVKKDPIVEYVQQPVQQYDGIFAQKQVIN